MSGEKEAYSLSFIFPCYTCLLFLKVLLHLYKSINWNGARYFENKHKLIWYKNIMAVFH